MASSNQVSTTRGNVEDYVNPRSVLGSKDEGWEDDDVDVVNLSVSNETPKKDLTRMGSVPTSTSTPSTNRQPECHFPPDCSPISDTLQRPPPAISPDSSGYSSSSPHSSSGGSRAASSGISGSYVTTPNQKGPADSTLDLCSKEAPVPSLVRRRPSSDSLSPPYRHHRLPDGAAHRGDNLQPLMKNVRTTYTSAQVRTLEKTFAKDQYPEPETIEELSREINVPCNKVKVWFQNRRARIRRRVGFPVPNYALAAYTPGVEGAALGVGPSMPPVPAPQQLHPAMSILPPGVPGASLPQTGALPGYPGFYPSVFPGTVPSVPHMYLNQCSLPQLPHPMSLYPDVGLYSYPLPGIPSFPQHKGDSDALSETDQSHLLYYPPPPVPAFYPSC